MSLGALLLATWSDGLGFGFLAVIMVPAWFCLVGLPLSGLAAIGLMSAQLRVAVPDSQPPKDRHRAFKRTFWASAWTLSGVGGYICAVACASGLAHYVERQDPSTSPTGAALTFALAAGYCVAVTPFAFVPILLLDERRPTGFTDVLVSSVALATRDFWPLLGGAVLAGLSMGLPLWLAVYVGNPVFCAVWLLAPWVTSGMLVQRYARLAPTVPPDPREAALPTAGVVLLGVWAALATLVALVLARVEVGDGASMRLFSETQLAVVVVPVGVGWLAVAVLLARAWSRARAVRLLLASTGNETAAFTGELLIGDAASVTATRAGIEVGGSVWVVGREARVQVPPGVHTTPSSLELPPTALAAGAPVTVVGTFRVVAQPGLRAASLDWPSRAWLLVGDYASARATLARRATRWTIALLLPILLLATVTSGALMLDLAEQAWRTTRG